jgi:hypothetical protein
MAAEQHRQRPDDEYLVISQEPIRRLMPASWSTIPWGLATAAFRVACGWPAVESGPAIARLAARRGRALCAGARDRLAA